MTLYEVALPFLIAAAAAFFAYFSGRAKAARLRSLQNDILQGNRRGYLILSAVIIMVFASIALQA